MTSPAARGARDPWTVMLSPGFLAALAALLLNDLVLKSSFDSWITGKISDVAGVFVIGVIGTAFGARHPGVVSLALAGLFVLWKSPASQPVIDGWNSLARPSIGRVVDYSDLLALGMMPVARWYGMVARPVAPRALQYPVVGAALLAILGTSVAPPLPIARQRDRVRLYAFHGGPVGFDIAAARGAILSALRAAGFSVEDRLLSSDVEIGSSVTCAATAADGPRLVHAHTRLRTAETGARLDLHAAALCGRGAEPTREEVIRVFSSEVIDRIGRGWSRRTNADRQ